MVGPAAADRTRVRVLVVDDMEDLRAVIAILLDMDGRFEVVGEAEDGIEGIASADRLQPDVVLLDRTMPRMSGLEALPEIRRVAPNASVVLYTAEADEGVHQTALGMGAVGVMDKTRGVTDLTVRLSEALLRAWGSDTYPTVQIGPVPSDCALDWIDNSCRIVEAVRANPELTEAPVDGEVLDTFEEYLATWREVAQANEEFVWAASATPSEVDRLLTAWATIDRIPEGQIEALGLSFTGERGRIFYDTITSAVMEAIARHEATRELAERLEPQWG